MQLHKEEQAGLQELQVQLALVWGGKSQAAGIHRSQRFAQGQDSDNEIIASILLP